MVCVMQEVRLDEDMIPSVITITELLKISSPLIYSNFIFLGLEVL